MAKVQIIKPALTQSSSMSAPGIEVNKTLQSVPVKNSNLEAEKGEIVVTNSTGSGLPELYTVAGNRHYSGGTPLNLPNASFVFSRDKSMNIDDEDILKMFGKTGNKKQTPADLAKQYQINEYRKILADKNSDKIQRETAELMIANYNEKLGKLGLIQESLKGFPDGIPQIAMPYIASSGFNPTDMFSTTGDSMPQNMDQAKYGGPVYNPVPEMYPAMYQKGGTTKEFHPYASADVAKFIDENNYYGTPLYQGTVSGSQKKNPKGGFGKQDRPYEDFYSSNKDLLDQFQKETGRRYDVNSNADAAWFQPKYNEQMVSDAVASGYTPEQAQSMINELGFRPHVSGDPRGLDSKTGDWTKSRSRFKFKPVEKPTPAQTSFQLTPPINSPAPPIVPGAPLTFPESPDIPAEFWLQDKVKTFGAMNDMLRIHKYMPWQATYNPNLMDPTFYDPTRELAANASAANISSQAIGMYAGPQAMNSRLAQVQGNATKNAADILGRYNNLNVGVANQFEANNTGIMNQFAADKANQATNLFDKNTIVNQQFDNSKNQARQNLRQSYIDAITNRGNTQALNSIQQQYQVDPSTGGYVQFTKGRPMVASTPVNQGAQLAQQVQELVNAGFTREEAVKYLSGQK